MLDDLIQEYIKKGVEFIPLKTAIEDPMYQIDPKYVAKYGSEFTYQILKSRNLTLRDAGMDVYQDYPEKKLEEICN